MMQVNSRPHRLGATTLKLGTRHAIVRQGPDRIGPGAPNHRGEGGEEPAQSGTSDTGDETGDLPSF